MGARLARPWSALYAAERFQFLDAAEILDRGAANPVSHGKLEKILAARGRWIWLGGSEPLEHPGAGHLVRALAQGGRFVFVETSGCALRRRIHEFPPLPGIIFVARFEEARLENSRDTRNPSAGLLALEGIRAAQLSGFWMVAHLPVSERTELAPLGEFAAGLRNIEMDGWLVTAANSSAAALQRAGGARRFISHPLWRHFSRIVEAVALRRFKARAAQEGRTIEAAPDSDAVLDSALPLAAQREAPREGVRS